MNIGVDFDFTITSNPAKFSELLNILARSANIYIISSYSGDTSATLEEAYASKKKQLGEWGIKYKELFLLGNPIPKNKAKLCAEYGIDVMIDDDINNLEEIYREAKGTICLQFKEW